MPVTVVVGGFYGSEAKAKAVVAAASKFKDKIVGIRCGGPNAGHTVFLNGHKYVLRMVPALVANPEAKLFICPGAMIDVALLNKEITEIEALGIPVLNRLVVDPEAIIVDPSYADTERTIGLGASIGSTQTGTGQTTSLRAMRMAIPLRQAGIMMRRLMVFDECILRTDDLLPILIQKEWQVFVEGTQGFGLSLFHSRHYPYCTSRDTTAAGFISEAGISPLDVKEIIMVIRTYPIRVGGNSGPMLNEISWDVVKQRSGATEDLVEMTSVTKKVRRVGEFDWELLRRAIYANKPTSIAIHGLDYLEWKDRGVRDWGEVSKLSREFITCVENRTETKVSMAFTGPHQDDMVWV